MNNASIDQDRLSRFLAEAHLRSGAGKGANGTIDVCFMQGANWLAGGDGKADSHPCIDPVIGQFGMRLNDASQFGEWRDDLKPFTPRVVGTNQGEEVSRKRGYMCADWAVRVIAPMAFDFWAELVPTRVDEARSWAKKLRNLAPIVDATSARVGHAVARDARAAAYTDAYTDAAAYTEAAEYAGGAAYAAGNAAARAAAYAAAYAAADAAADAAARAAVDAGADAAARSKADAFSRSLWDESLRFLGELIAVTEVTQ